MNPFKTTATYGKRLKKTDVALQYFLRVYTGGFAGIATATGRARAEADRFLEESEFSSYEILESKRVWLPFSCVEFLFNFR